MIADDPIIRDVLRRSMVARIATLSRSARPSITPIYFVCLNGHIWLGTSDWTLAAREVQADRRVSLLFNVEQDSHDHRLVRITGRATVRTDAAAQRAYNRQVASKYILNPRGIFHYLAHLRQYLLMHRYHAQSAEKGQPCVIEVTPEKVELLGEEWESTRN